MNIEDIKRLSQEEQLALISEIWDNLEKDLIKIPTAQIEEVRSRIQKIKEGRSKFYSWDDIKSRLHSKQ